MIQTVGGFLEGAAATGKYVFGNGSDISFCAGDFNWITGHTCVVYTSLVLGVTTVVFEETPAYSTFSRYWEVNEKHDVSEFYVDPTVLRLLKRAGDTHCKESMKYLQAIGSVDQPVAADVWR